MYAIRSYYDIPGFKQVKMDTYQSHCVIGNIAYNAQDEKRMGIVITSYSIHYTKLYDSHSFVILCVVSNVANHAMILVSFHFYPFN